MIEPSRPLELPPLDVGDELDGESEGDGDDDEADGVGDAGGLLAGGVVCVDFDGLAEDGWLAGLDDFPDFPVSGV